ncbi:MAG: hypothetical protein IKD80_02470, partial [Selenomonadaceae bacterium]|nr:hypothetical protein [Selenomonadaceae bacterium]
FSLLVQRKSSKKKRPLAGALVVIVPTLQLPETARVACENVTFSAATEARVHARLKLRGGRHAKKNS